MIKKIMKTFLIFTFCFFLFSNAKAQKPEDLLFEISIQSGASYIGITKIHYMYEGLICRTFVNKKRQRKRVNFVSGSKLDSKKIISLFEYIQINGLMNLEYDFEGNDLYHPPIKIRIYDVVNNEFVEYKYNQYYPVLDELIVLLNDLVPKKNQKMYKTKRIPK